MRPECSFHRDYAAWPGRAIVEAMRCSPVPPRRKSLVLADLSDDDLAELAHGVRFELGLRLARLDAASYLLD